MIEKNISSVVAYYTAMAHKDLHAMTPYLHQHVHLISPFGITHGKEAVLKAAEQFFSCFESLSIRAKFGSGNQVMIVIDVTCPPPVGLLRTAVLITFQDHLIASTELFHDTQVFDKKRDALSA